MNPDDLRQFDTFRARFQPCADELVRPEMLPIIGHEFTFTAMWMIEPEDGRAHAGHWACTLDTTMADIPATWIASADLVAV